MAISSIRNVVLGISSTAFCLSITSYAYAQSSQPTSESRVSATTFVNLLDGPNTQRATGLNPFAQSSASGGGGSASASSGSTLRLGASAESKNVGLSNPSQGSAGFGISYRLLGNSGNLSIPLTFNFSLDGSLNVETAPEAGSVAVASIRYSLIDNSSSSGGSSILSSQRGIPLFSISNGNFGDSSRFGARVKPTISLAALNIRDVELTDSDIKDLKLDKDIPLDFLQQETSLIAGTIATAIQAIGIPRLNVPAGRFGSADFDLGFDTSFFFDSKIKLTREVQSNGLLVGTLTTGASSSQLNASANSKFDATLKLTSITVPQTFNAIDINTLKVLFDSGSSLDVTREFDDGSLDGDNISEIGEDNNSENSGGGNIEAVPEPASLMGILLATGGLLRLRGKIAHRRSD